MTLKSIHFTDLTKIELTRPNSNPSLSLSLSLGICHVSEHPLHNFTREEISPQHCINHKAS